MNIVQKQDYECNNMCMPLDVLFSEIPSLHLRVMFKDGKNDYYSEGAERVVAANTHEPRFCPVRLTQNYFEFLGGNFNGFLVPSCLPTSGPDPSKNVPYSGALEDLRALLFDLGHNGKRFGEHSGKRGGASMAVENGMDMETLKRLRRWPLPSKYVDLGTKARIEMSRMLQKRL